MNKTMISAATAVLLAIGLLFSAPAAAQSDQSEWGETPGAAEEPAVESQEVRKAAQAYKRIGDINQELQEDIQDAGDQEERMQMQRDAEAKMIRSIQEVGLDVQTYNQVINAVRTDEELREEFESSL
ncbi:MAG: DUF4168 domain-containing protein [Desulfococcaceae bacterium]